MTNEAWIALGSLSAVVIGALVALVWTAAWETKRNQDQDEWIRQLVKRVDALEGKKPNKRDSDTIKYPGGEAS